MSERGFSRTGGSPPQAELAITHERGQLVRQLRTTIKAAQGDAGWEALLAEVSEPCRRAFSGPIGIFEWVDAGLAAELSLAFYRGEAGPLTGARGREAAREQLTTVNQWMLRFLSPSFLLSNLPRFFRFYFQGGLLEVDHEGEGSATVHIWAIGLYPAYWTDGVPGWLEEALRMTGCEVVAVRFEAPGPGAQGSEAHHYRYHLAWR